MIKLILLFLISLNVFSQENNHQQISRHRVIVDDYENESKYNIINESNIFRNVLYENIFLEYQADDKIDLGVFVSNIPVINSGGQNYEYDSYVYFTKWYKLSENWNLGLGSQNGTTLFTQSRSFHSFSYLQNSYKINDYLNVNFGAFYVNYALATKDQPIGASVGVNMNFIDKVLWSEYSFLSGNSNISGSVINIFYRVAKPFTVYFGAQIPATNSGNEFAGNIGIVYSFEHQSDLIE